MSNGEHDPRTGQELRTFFEQLRDEGQTPVYEAYIDKLEQNGTLGQEAADLLRAGAYDIVILDKVVDGAAGRDEIPLYCLGR